MQTNYGKLPIEEYAKGKVRLVQGGVVGGHALAKGELTSVDPGSR
jgi:hypothetical protein